MHHDCRTIGGGAPLVWAIINGELKTGISLFQLQNGVDNGLLLGQREVDIRYGDTIREVYSNIEIQGLNLLREKIPRYLRGDIIPYPQSMIDGYEYKPWPLRDQQDGIISWNQNPLQIYNFVRAQTKPYPGAFSFIEGMKVIIWKCSIYPFVHETSCPSGSIIKIVTEGPMKGFLVACQKGDCPVLIQDIQYNGRDYNALDFIEQLNIHVGDCFK
jgi:methionyl-tRNA formyltransferase